MLRWDQAQVFSAHKNEKLPMRVLLQQQIKDLQAQPATPRSNRPLARALRDLCKVERACFPHG
jgi:hypothetical protein